MASSKMRSDESRETLAALAFAGFEELTKPGKKAVLTTCLPTDRKDFQSREFRAIMSNNQITGCSGAGTAPHLGYYTAYPLGSFPFAQSP